jgi:hypothetical protein
MSGVLKASVPINLDGQDYVLRYRALAFIRYAEEVKGDLLEDLAKIGAQMTNAGLAMQTGTGGAGLGVPLGIVVNVLWAGLVDAQPMLKRDDVARMVDFRSLTVVVPAITQAIQLTMPETQPDRPIGTRAELPLVRVNGLESGPASETPAELQPTSSSA